MENFAAKFHGKKTIVFSKSVTVIFFRSKIWPIVIFWFQNLTRCKKVNSKSLRTLSFSFHNLTILFCQFKNWQWEEIYFRLWHVAKNKTFQILTRFKSLKAKIDISELFLTKTSLFDFFSIQMCYVVNCFASVCNTWKNLVFQNLLHYYFLNPNFDTIWIFRFKSCHVVRDWIQNLWQVLDSWYHNPKLLFLNLKFGLEKKFTSDSDKLKTFVSRSLTCFKKMKLKSDGLQNSPTKNLTVRFFFNSKSNTS